MNKSERFLTAEELAVHLRLRPSTVKAWAREGRIPVIRPTKRVARFDLEAVIRVLRSLDESSGRALDGKDQGREEVRDVLL